jgi:hypothetical protein
MQPKPDVHLYGRVDAVSLPAPTVSPSENDRAALAEARYCTDAANKAIAALEEAQRQSRAQRAMAVCQMAVCLAGEDDLARTSLCVFMAAAIRDMDESYFNLRFLN